MRGSHLCTIKQRSVFSHPLFFFFLLPYHATLQFFLISYICHTPWFYFHLLPCFASAFNHPFKFGFFFFPESILKPYKLPQ